MTLSTNAVFYVISTVALRLIEKISTMEDNKIIEVQSDEKENEDNEETNNEA